MSPSTILGDLPGGIFSEASDKIDEIVGDSNGLEGNCNRFHRGAVKSFKPVKVSNIDRFQWSHLFLFQSYFEHFDKGVELVRGVSSADKTLL